MSGGSESPMLVLRCRLALQQRKVDPGVASGVHSSTIQIHLPRLRRLASSRVGVFNRIPYGYNISRV